MLPLLDLAFRVPDRTNEQHRLKHTAATISEACMRALGNSLPPSSSPAKIQMESFLYKYVSTVCSQLSSTAYHIHQFIDMSLSYKIRQALTSSLPAALLASTTVLAGTPASCPNTPLSCKNTTAIADTCCFNAPGGLLLLTQFWDTNPPTGPDDSWTVHGLWYVSQKILM